MKSIIVISAILALLGSGDFEKLSRQVNELATKEYQLGKHETHIRDARKLLLSTDGANFYREQRDIKQALREYYPGLVVKGF